MKLRVASLLVGLAAPLVAADYIPVIPNPDRVEEGIRFDDIFQVVMPDGTIQEFVRCGAPILEEEIEVLGPLSPLGGSTADCDSSTNPDPIYDPGKSYLIDVWVHVLENAAGTSGQVPEAEIYEQIAILNEDLRAIPGSNGGPGTNGRLFFRLKGHEVSNDNNWYNDIGTYYNSLAVDPVHVINVYTNQAGGNLGYVPFLPHQSPGSIGTNADRIVIFWQTFGRDRLLFPQYDLGRTLTHELGHYLGQGHTFQGGCANPATCYSNGDWICDTPPESSPYFGCAGARDSCPAYAGTDPIDNYMDYSDDVCMNKFTLEQMRRVRCTIEHYRTGLFLQEVIWYDDFETGNFGDWSNVV